VKGNFGWLVWTSGGEVATDVWTHVAATYDGATAVIYVDGFEVASESASETFKESDWLIGSQRAADTFGGLIDDVRVYDYALSATEVEALAGQ
jgi:hypothetical protein